MARAALARSQSRPLHSGREPFVALNMAAIPDEQAVILCPENVIEVPLSLLPENLGGRGWRGGRTVAGQDHPATLAEMEQRYIFSVLQRTGGNKSEAARVLAIGYKTLLRKLNQVSAEI